MNRKKREIGRWRIRDREDGKWVGRGYERTAKRRDYRRGAEVTGRNEEIVRQIYSFTRGKTTQYTLNVP